MPLTKFNVVKMKGHRVLAVLESHNGNVAKDFTNVIKTFHRDLRVLSRAKHSERLFSEIQEVCFCFTAGFCEDDTSQILMVP